MKRTVTRAAMAMLTACSVAAASQAAACTISFPIVIEPDEPPNYRAECRAVIEDMDAYLTGRSADDGGAYPAQIAAALRDGSANCDRRPVLAFALVDSLLGSPVRYSPGSDAVKQFHNWIPDGFDQDRIDEVAIGSWITNHTYFSWSCAGSGYSRRLPHGYSEEQVMQFLSRPDYRAAAMANFGHNPARDRVILRQLIDPDGEYFDLAEAVRLTPYYYARGENIRPKLIDIDVAEAIADPRLGVPDYEAAARLLGWYSPVLFLGIPEEAKNRADALYVRISQSRLSSSDPQLRRQAMLFFETGDPNGEPAVPLSDVLPDDVEVTILDRWPDSLTPAPDIERFGDRIAANYPGRAINVGQYGRVEFGIVFGPDGAFHSLHVTRGSFEILEDAAKRGFERYFRPRTYEMRLEGFEGRYVYVPLPSVEYVHAYQPRNTQKGYDAARNTIVVPANILRRYR